MADNNRKMTREEMEAEIRACKALLAESDYNVIKTLEGLCDCTTATAIANFLKTVTTEIKEIINKRVALRQTINDLEAELENAATQDED